MSEFLNALPHEGHSLTESRAAPECRRDADDLKDVFFCRPLVKADPLYDKSCKIHLER